MRVRLHREEGLEKKAFSIDIETREGGVGQVKLIVEESNHCIEEASPLREYSLTLSKRPRPPVTDMLPEGCAAPQAGLGAPDCSTDRKKTPLNSICYWEAAGNLINSRAIIALKLRK